MAKYTSMPHADLYLEKQTSINLATGNLKIGIIK